MSSGKRVHFVDPNTGSIISPDPLTPPVIPLSPFTPSPAYSAYSLPSSVGPVTPPSLLFPLSPIRIRGEIIVHPVIAYNERTPPLNFDVTNSLSNLPFESSPSSNILRNNVSARINHPSLAHLNFEPALLNEPATYPPLSSITLISDLLPWEIRVENYSCPAIVTIYDVLQKLHVTLRVPITPWEWSQVPFATQHLVSVAFYQRLDGIRDINKRERQRRKGVRRVDFLMSRVKLIGLTPVPDKRGIFLMSWG